MEEIDKLFELPEFKEALETAPEDQREEIKKMVKDFATDFYTQIVVPLQELNKKPS